MLRICKWVDSWRHFAVRKWNFEKIDLLSLYKFSQCRLCDTVKGIFFSFFHNLYIQLHDTQLEHNISKKLFLKLVSIGTTTEFRANISKLARGCWRTWQITILAFVNTNDMETSVLVSWTLAKLSTYGQTVSIDKRTFPYPRERGWVVHVIYIDEEVLIPHNLGIWSP